MKRRKTYRNRRKSRAIYRSYLRGKKWQAKRQVVLRSAGGMCACGKPATEVHHLTYKRIFRERLSDLQALCPQCHRQKHKRRK